MTTRLLVGADIGGTSTKIAVATTEGRLLAYRTGPGGNIRSSPDVAATIASTLDDALGDLPRAAVVAATFGVAGAGPAGHAEIDALCQDIWLRSRSSGPLTVRSDLEIAYASAAHGPDGLLLLAGTGAVACSLHDYAVTGRCDGMGWLLGDVGSAVWFGRSAIAAVAAALDHRGPRTALTDAVLDHHGLTGSPDPRQDLISAVYPRPVSELGRLAPLVATAAETGDRVALGLVHDGVAGLLTAVRGALADDPARADDAFPADLEIVLAGALLTTPGLLRTRVRDALHATGVDPTLLRDASTPIVGALDRAARTAHGEPLDRAALSRAITTAAQG